MKTIKSNCTDAELSAELRWRSVEHEAPEGDEVICWDGETVSTYYPETGSEYSIKDRAAMLGITHWMRLPEPPSAPPTVAPWRRRRAHES